MACTTTSIIMLRMNFFSTVQINAMKIRLVAQGRTTCIRKSERVHSFGIQFLCRSELLTREKITLFNFPTDQPFPTGHFIRLCRFSRIRITWAGGGGSITSHLSQGHPPGFFHTFSFHSRNSYGNKTAN